MTGSGFEAPSTNSRDGAAFAPSGPTGNFAVDHGTPRPVDLDELVIGGDPPRRGTHICKDVQIKMRSNFFLKLLVNEYHISLRRRSAHCRWEPQRHWRLNSVFAPSCLLGVPLSSMEIQLVMNFEEIFKIKYYFYNCHRCSDTVPKFWSCCDSPRNRCNWRSRISLGRYRSTSGLRYFCIDPRP